jgi:hypothetical protein
MNNYRYRCALFLALFLSLVFGSGAFAATYTVTTTADAGVGSLRAAITSANAVPGSRITFRIPGVSSGGPRVIALNSPLPDVTANGTTIEGSTQSSYIDCNPTGPDIAIDAANYYDFDDYYGLLPVFAGNCVIEGLMFTRYSGTGISISDLQNDPNGGNTVKGCWFGLAADGKTASRQDNYDGIGPSYGIRVSSSGNILGGTTESSKNIIVGMGVRIAPGTGVQSMSGRAYGIFITGDDNKVLGNYLGVGSDGVTPFKNHVGVSASGKRNIIGQVGAGNVFGGGSWGIELERATDTSISANSFGVAANGTTILGQFTHAIMISGSTGTTVGGTTSGSGNVIANCTFSGVLSMLDYDNVTAKQAISIWGNYFGSNRSGATLPQVICGIWVGTSDAIIGGVEPGQANVFNGCASASQFTSSNLNGNTIYPKAITMRGNVIKNSTILPVNIAFGTGEGPNNETYNDIRDIDIGTNGRQNYPDISKVEVTHNAKTIISGNLNSTPSKTFTLDFYANSKASVSGYGDAERYLGAAQVTTDSKGDAPFSLTFSGVVAGENCSATATDSEGSTSEFSKAVIAASVPNRSPILSSVTLSPASPQTNAILTVNPTATDADGDTITYAYIWKKNGVILAGETKASLDLSKAGSGDSKDIITATVIARDSLSSSASSSASVTIANTAPILGVQTTFYLDNIAEDDITNNGTSIEKILASEKYDPITDADRNDVLGIALSSTGDPLEIVSRFEFTLDNGVTWVPLTIAGTRLLACD